MGMYASKLGGLGTCSPRKLFSCFWVHFGTEAEP